MPRPWCPDLDLHRPASVRATAYALINAVYQLSQLVDGRDRAYIAGRMTAMAEELAVLPPRRDATMAIPEDCEAEAAQALISDLAMVPAAMTFGAAARASADRLIDRLGWLARYSDPTGLGYIAWRLGQTTNDICYAASDAGKNQRQRLDDLAWTRAIMVEFERRLDSARLVAHSS